MLRLVTDNVFHRKDYSYLSYIVTPCLMTFPGIPPINKFGSSKAEDSIEPAATIEPSVIAAPPLSTTLLIHIQEFEPIVIGIDRG